MMMMMMMMMMRMMMRMIIIIIIIVVVVVVAIIIIQVFGYSLLQRQGRSSWPSLETTLGDAVAATLRY